MSDKTTELKPCGFLPKCEWQYNEHEQGKGTVVMCGQVLSVYYSKACYKACASPTRPTPTIAENRNE